MDKLARRLGYDPALKNPGAVLISDYEEITGKIRDCYDRVMGEQAGNGEES
jgi:[glutamine synthetase] adenylyltransferase / [glutamine synthetase]-adenylyl-L-tyrosine phosphorylase